MTDPLAHHDAALRTPDTVARYGFSVPFELVVHSTRDAFAPDNDCLTRVMTAPSGKPARALVYLDEGVVRSIPDLPRRIHAWFAANEARGVQLAAVPDIVSGGEVAKGDLAILDRVGRAAFDHKICRHSYVVIVGGGAVLDAVGCAASLVHRGLRQIRLPTTVLGQCDAGLGVKNGLNRFGAKNFFGTFTPPAAIINDARFLESLDERSWRAGISEAVKVAIIKDAPFLDELIQSAPALAARDMPAMERLIARCATLHLEHITQGGDPFEHGSSRPLDFGHWSAHRLEVITNHKLMHGEAVAIGVAIDSLYAVEIGRLTRDEVDGILGCLHTCGFRLWHEALDLKDVSGRRSVLTGLEQFREHLGGELTLAMPDGLGRRRDITSFDEAAFERALAALRRWRRRASTEHPQSSRQS
ncbi:MAG: 3-dehydroquinate synthase [Planctomycetes bacterium]|nr:3-dehydroquinate synthase [Planctomycetota bacterium]